MPTANVLSLRYDVQLDSWTVLETADTEVALALGSGGSTGQWRIQNMEPLFCTVINYS